MAIQLNNSWRDYVRRVTPYVPGEQPQGEPVVKLNTNECPYPPSKKVMEALKNFDYSRLRRYPDPESKVLAKAFAQKYGVCEDELFFGVGSDEILALIFMTFFSQVKLPICFPDITYSFYKVWVDLYNIPFITLPLDDKFKIKPEAYTGWISGVVLANPNAPTGIYESVSTLESIVRANNEAVIIIDEAYVGFGGQSALPLIKKYDNLLIVGTLSKSRSLAGARVGYAAGSAELIRHIKDIKYSFNSYTLNTLSEEIAAASLSDDEYFRETVDKIINTRERTKARLKELGFEFTDSLANFVFAKHKSLPAKEIYNLLKQKDIYVRHFDLPRIDNYLRITIGTDEEMDIALKELSNICKNG